MAKIKIACAQCGGEDVVRDACAIWDAGSQQWELSAVYDSFTCDNCGDDICVEEVEIPPPDFDNTQAQSEGWGIFETDGSSSGPYQLQRMDDEEVFEDDDAAARFVQQRASYGHHYHASALEFLREHNPIEYAAITEGREAAIKAAVAHWAANN